MKTSRLIEDRAVAEVAFSCTEIPGLIDLIESGWATFEPYAEKDFCDRFNRTIFQLSENSSCKTKWIPISDNLINVWWEMHIANKLLESGLCLVKNILKPLRKNSANIDHLLVANNGDRTWIECTQAMRGPISRSLPGFDVEGCGYKPKKEMMLRVTTRLEEKASHNSSSQIMRFRKAYPEFEDDCYVIALGTGNLPNDDGNSTSPSVAYDAVYGLGNPAWTVNRDGSNCSFQGIRAQPQVEKKQGTRIKMEGFLDGEYSLISGMIVSNATLFNPSKSIQLIENITSMVPLSNAVSSVFDIWSFNSDQMTLVRPEID